MNYLLMTVSVFATAVNYSLRNKFGNDKLSQLSDCFIFNAVVSTAAIAVLTLLSGGLKPVSLYTVVVGSIFGVVICAELLVSLKALACGPMSFTVLISSCGMIIPTLSGVLFWDEKVKFAQYCGIVLMLAAIVLAVNPKKDKQISGKWIALTMLLFFLSGSMGVIQKIHQTSSHADELSGCLVIAFSVNLGLILIGALFSLAKDRKKIEKKSASFFVGGASSGICLALIHHINIYLSGRMESAFFFPTINGACIMATIIASVMVFGESLTKRRVAALIIGTMAIMLVGNVTDLLFK